MFLKVMATMKQIWCLTGAFKITQLTNGVSENHWRLQIGFRRILSSLRFVPKVASLRKYKFWGIPKVFSPLGSNSPAI